ncbi:MAG TPA: type II secretion system protein F [Rhodospirillaceae bacterium]|nr:MAG: hypothetical protein A2018_06595 [Alphaproteobacteria bacterium GWF2_58_20]HAU29852.1 type II secretion system protein F [Rhodospirillaceae bacterium]
MSSYAASLGFAQKFARSSVRRDSKARLRVYRKLSGMARAGVPLPKSLESIWNLETEYGKKTGGSMAQALGSWKRAVDNGDTFGTAVADWVPDRERMLLEAAGSARLDIALDNTAKVLESGIAMVSAIKGGITYPLVMLVGAMGLMWGFGVSIIPTFATIKPMEEWTGQAGQMALLSTLINDYGLVFVAAILGIIALIAWSMPRWRGDIRTRFDESVPPWTFYRLLNGTSFLMSLSALIKAGVPVPEALRKIKTAASPWLKERLDTTLYHVNEGQQLGEALHLAGYRFPDREIVEDLRLFSSLGNFDERLSNLAEEWIREGVNAVKTQAQMLNLGMMALLGVAIGWMAMGLMALMGEVTKGLT